MARAKPSSTSRSAELHSFASFSGILFKSRQGPFCPFPYTLSLFSCIASARWGRARSPLPSSFTFAARLTACASSPRVTSLMTGVGFATNTTDAPGLCSSMQSTSGIMPSMQSLPELSKKKTAFLYGDFLNLRANCLDPSYTHCSFSSIPCRISEKSIEPPPASYSCIVDIEPQSYTLPASTLHRYPRILFSSSPSSLNFRITEGRREKAVSVSFTLSS
mmetsp:Transcript_20178/g.51519  ORF Transcript_20178/g.51519 Transcript_20178/m.51519 type:complete len:219 (+) Transcript_20178:258-914(+)